MNFIAAIRLKPTITKVQQCFLINARSFIKKFELSSVGIPDSYRDSGSA